MAEPRWLPFGNHLISTSYDVITSYCGPQRCIFRRSIYPGMKAFYLFNPLGSHIVSDNGTTEGETAFECSYASCSRLKKFEGVIQISQTIIRIVFRNSIHVAFSMRNKYLCVSLATNLHSTWADICFDYFYWHEHRFLIGIRVKL